MKKIFRRIGIGLAGLYVLSIGVLYFIQEKLIFFPEKLESGYRFEFVQRFEELNFPMRDGVRLNGLLFKADTARGLIFYLHGNAGSLKSWGSVAGFYTGLGYDLFIPDYRGYGKSEGRVSSEAQLHRDVQAMYDSMKRRYSERGIIVLGYSIGTGPAAHLAAENAPGRLILQAPYYSLTGMMRREYPIIPAFILKYPLRTGDDLRQCKMPVTVFHGDADEVIPYENALRLKAVLKPGDTLITLKGQGHNGMSDNPQYRAAMAVMLRP